MPRPPKEWVLGLTAQACCVAVALWLFGACASREFWAVEKSGQWARLAQVGAAWRQAAAVPPDQALSARSLQQLMASVPGPRYQSARISADSAAGDAPGMRWSPEEDDRGLTRGTLRRDRAEFPAVCWPVAEGGHLVLWESGTDRQSLLGPLGRRLLILGGIAMVWVCALQFMAAFLVTSRLRERLRKRDSESSHELVRQAHQLVRARNAIIFALARLAEFRDSDTGDHLERVTVYARMLADAARRHPRYAREITPDFVHMIELTAALHDIGKVGLEDAILRKHGVLTTEERSRMQVHTVIAADCLRDIARRMGPSPLLRMASEIAVAHHERWDGAGYPHGLRGNQIPLAARIVAIVDAYDALMSRRPYKEPYPHLESVAFVREGAGRQFDPDLVEIWLTVADTFEAIAARYAGSMKAPVEDSGPRLEDEVTPADQPALCATAADPCGGSIDGPGR